jgi:hypothetical protein
LERDGLHNLIRLCAVDMTGDFRRKHPREYHVSFVRYYLNVLDTGKPKEVYDVGVSVDISAGGLGLITRYPVEVGHCLLFKDVNRVNNIRADASVVRWAQEFSDQMFRIGLEFIE